MANQYNLKNIRALLVNGFSESELRTFIFEESDFEDVYNQLSQGTGTYEIVQLLLDHAKRKSLIEHLLTWAKEYNPAMYEKYQPYHGITISPTTSSSVHAKSQRAEFQYDVFISYSHRDGEWIWNWLVPRLRQIDLKVCLDLDSFEHGKPLVEAIERAVRTSRKAVLVLTPNYLGSGWAEFENLIVQTLDPAAQKLRLIPILLERCELPLRISYLTYLDFTSPSQMEFQFQRLVTAIRSGAPSETPNNLPQPDYVEFIGRTEEIKVISEHLDPEDAYWIMNISGIGGVGKTALALEVAWRCAEGRLASFDAIIWASAKKEILTPEGRIRVSGADVTLEAIFDRIGEPFGVKISNMDHQDKEREALRLLRDNRCLLVVDNLETLEDPKSVLSFLGPSLARIVKRSDTKVITTSRHKKAISGDFLLQLTGLSPDESCLLLRQEGRSKNVLEISGADDHTLNRIHESTSGHPLAMRMLVGRMKTYSTPINQILDRTDTVIDRTQVPEFICQDSYDMLLREEKDILAAMPLFGAPASEAAISAASTIRGVHLENGLERLCSLCLIERGREGRSTIPPLVRTFLENLGDNPVNREEAYLRLAKYYGKYLEKYSVPEYYNELDLEKDNIIATLRFCASIQEWGVVTSQARKLSDFLTRRDYWKDLLDLGLLARRASEELHDGFSSAWHTVYDISWVYIWWGLFDKAREEIEKVLSKSNIENPAFQEVIAVAWRNLGLIELCEEKGQFDKALCHFMDSLQIMEARRDRKGIARIEGTLGLLYLKHGKYEAAHKYLESALSANQMELNDEGLVMNLVDLGEVARRQENLPRARALFERARFIAQENKGHDRYAYVLMHLAHLQKDYGRLAEASSLTEEANRIYASLGAKYWENKANLLLTELRHLGVSARIKTPTLRIEEFSAKIQEMVQEFREQEKLHRNSPEKYLATIPQIYDHILTVGQNAQLSLPLSFQFEITNKCNTRCRMCSRWTWVNDKNYFRQELSTEAIKKFLEDLAPNYSVPRSITLSGGEPLCRPDFIEIIKHAKQSGWKVGILTNGIAVSEEATEAIVQNAEWIRISIDATEEKYSDIRRPEATEGLEDLQRTFRRLRSAQAKFSTRCRIGASYTIQDRNIKDVGQMLEIFSQRFLPIIDSLLVFKFAHGPHNEGGFLCKKSDLEEFKANFLGSTLLDGAFNFSYLKRFVEEYSNICDIAIGKPLQTFYSKHEITCFTPYLFSLIDAFGDVYPCCFLYEDNRPYGGEAARVRKEFRMGNILESSFDDIWNSEKYRAFRFRMQPITVDQTRGGIPQCAECTRHYFPNYFLTTVYELYKDMAFTLGNEKAAAALREIVEGYPPAVAWF